MVKIQNISLASKEEALFPSSGWVTPFEVNMLGIIGLLSSGTLGDTSLKFPNEHSVALNVVKTKKNHVWNCHNCCAPLEEYHKLYEPTQTQKGQETSKSSSFVYMYMCV